MPTCYRFLLVAALATHLAPGAVGQGAGEVIWTLDFPAVGPVYAGPDGTVYLITDSLNAITPNGELLWKAPASASYVDVGPDGTIYTAGVHTIYAYHPDGSERWRFTDTGGWGITTGPTLGPDGNLYAVFIQGGLGVFSLTPEGEFRWNVPGFFTSDGREVARVAFGPDRVYYADDTYRVLGCTNNPAVGLVAITLDGELAWCHSISGINDPARGVVSTLDGRAIITQIAQPNDYLRAYAPDGEIDWTQTFLPSAIGVGPDNNLYAFLGSTLISLTADGDIRWSKVQPINNFPVRPVVTPDLSAVVFGSVYGFGENGFIAAADPADGSTLWSIPVTGPSAGAGTIAVSPDGAVAYVTVGTVSPTEPDQLWAVRVRDAVGTPTEASPAEARDLTLSSAFPNPFERSTRFSLSVNRPQRVTVEVLDVLGRRVALLHDGELPAGAQHELAFEAGALPAGAYLVRATGEGLTESRRVTILK